MGRGEARDALATGFPFAIDEDGTESGARGEEVASRKIPADHGVRDSGISDPDVGDMVGNQGLTLRGADNPFAGASTDAVCFDERRMIHGSGMVGREDFDDFCECFPPGVAESVAPSVQGGWAAESEYLLNDAIAGKTQVGAGLA